MQSWGSQREVEKPKRQMSVAQLPADQQDAVMASVGRANERYEQVTVEDCGLHVCQFDGTWQVWLNTDDTTFTGLCLAVGATRDDAVTAAVKTLEAVVEHLQQPVLA